jgi:hypothetical protein
MYYLF